jgi:hypothetical protein
MSDSQKAELWHHSWDTILLFMIICNLIPNLECVFASLKMPKMKSVPFLAVMEKKDLTRKVVIAFQVTFPIYTLTFLNVSGHVI